MLANRNPPHPPHLPISPHRPSRGGYIRHRVSYSPPVACCFHYEMTGVASVAGIAPKFLERLFGGRLWRELHPLRTSTPASGIPMV
jgi:hypothetical protein